MSSLPTPTPLVSARTDRQHPIAMQRPSTSRAPETPVEKQLRFAPEDVEWNPESSDSEEEELLRTPPSRASNPCIKDEPSPPEARFTPLPREGGYHSPVGGRQNEFKPYPPFPSYACPVLHPTLDTGASFIWDVATNPEDLKFMPMEGDHPAEKTQSGHHLVSRLELKLEGIYQWPIAVEAHDGQYLTLRDALVAIHKNVMKLVAEQDLDVLDEHTRRRVYETREERCREFSLDPLREGLRRVDFLLGARRFLGVSPSPGMNKFTLNVGILPS